MTYQVLARKWRPRRFEDVVGQSPIVQTLKNALDQQQLHHAYLFTGTRGVGKTTLARIFAKCLNCEAGVRATPCDTCSHCQEIDSGRFPDLFEIDAASRTKVEDTREILENVLYKPVKGRYKVYLIDEVHMLSHHSFNALLKTLEEPPPHVKFLLATTEYQKLPATILSRCLQFHLTLMQPEQISAHLQHILTTDHIPYELPAIAQLAKAAQGSMRDALSLLDQSIAYGNGTVLNADVSSMLGTISPAILLDLLTALSQKDSHNLFASLKQLATLGVNFATALADLLELVHQIAVIQALALTNQKIETALQSPLHILANNLSREDVQLFYQIGVMGSRDLPFAPTPQIGFEMTLMRMLAFYPQEITPPNKLTDKSMPATAPTAPTALPQTALPLQLNWPELFTQLDITGATKALAQQCSLKIFTDKNLILILHAKQKPLLQKQHIERMRDAVCKLLGRDILVSIELGEHENPTPALLAAQEKQAQETKIINDNQVQRIMQTFDAQLIKTN